MINSPDSLMPAIRRLREEAIALTFQTFTSFCGASICKTYIYIYKHWQPCLRLPRILLHHPYLEWFLRFPESGNIDKGSGGSTKAYIKCVELLINIPQHRASLMQNGAMEGEKKVQKKYDKWPRWKRTAWKQNWKLLQSGKTNVMTPPVSLPSNTTGKGGGVLRQVLQKLVFEVSSVFRDPGTSNHRAW